ncbi:MAG: glycosyltransferase, partial [Spirochaetota bacterium]
MKIAVIFPKDSEALFNRNSSRTFGGANVQMFMIARELGKKEGVEACSLVPNYETIDFTDSEHFNLVKTFNENDSIIKKVLTYHRVIREIKPDVIIQRGLTLISCFLSVYCRLLGIEYVFMFAHDIESHGRYQRDRKRCLLFPLLMRTVYLAVPQNQYEKDQLKGYDRGGNIKILKKGIEIETIRGFISEGIQKKYDAIWVARCERWKHPEIFLDLARNNPELRFLMICSPVDGQEEYYNSVKDAAEGIDNIEFIAFVKNNGIYELLAASRVFCITSDMEGDWPMTVLEAGAVG